MTGLTNNPYAPPSANVNDPGAAGGNLIPGGRTVPAGNGLSWIGSGWNMFKEAPAPWIGLFLIFIVLWIVVSCIPLINFFTALIFPIFMGGIMIAAHNQRETGSLNIGDLFAGFQQKAAPLVLLGLLTLGLTIVAMIPVIIIVVAGGLMAIGSSGFNLSNLGAILGTVGIAVIIAVALMSLVYAAVWFAPALIVIHDVAPLDAMKMSFFASFRNWTAGILYFLLAIVLLVLACIPFGLGLLVMGPVMYASIYTSYRDIFVEE